MAIPPETKERLLKETREAAAAFIEDIAHVRNTLCADPDRGGVRRLSSVLRRLLIDNGGDLPRIASPRVGRLMFLEPDNQPVYRADRKHPFSFFGSHGVVVFGAEFRAVAYHAPQSAQDLVGFDPTRMVTVGIE